MKIIIFVDTKKTFAVQAHQSQVGCMELNSVGTRLATASEKVMIISLFIFN